MVMVEGASRPQVRRQGGSFHLWPTVSLVVHRTGDQQTVTVGVQHCPAPAFYPPFVSPVDQQPENTKPRRSGIKIKSNPGFISSQCKLTGYKWFSDERDQDNRFPRFYICTMGE